MPELDYLDDLHRESARFHDCLATVDPLAPVPSCPEWTAQDLLWHLTEVQTFWGRIVRDRLRDMDERETAKPDTDYQGLLGEFLAANEALESALTLADPDEQVWTWSDDHTVGFVRRRQAHESLIHRLDAELIVGQVTVFDPALAADGVDEALTVMYGGYPAWASFTPTGKGGCLVTTDTGHRWDFVHGRFYGTSPNSGKTYDDPTIEIRGGHSRTPPGFTVSASAADLDAWLWRRPGFPEPVVTGDQEAASEFLAVIADGVQ